jgi:hypothetical protein
MRGNKSPAPPVRSAPRGGVLNPKRATPLNKTIEIWDEKKRAVIELMKDYLKKSAKWNTAEITG